MAAKSEMKKVASVMVMILAIVVFIFEQVDGSPACDRNNGLICLAKCLISECQIFLEDFPLYLKCVGDCGSKCRY